ncbi:hypothetical protein LH464_21530, partial [Neorhizobium sp. T786]|nr:hypothetical protein [Neorhizobium xiangyangii]
MNTDKAMVTDARISLIASKIGGGSTFSEDDRLEMASTIFAALTLERGEAEPVAVKPLEWVEGPQGHYTDYAQSLLGQWSTWEISGHAYYRAPEMHCGKLSGSSLEDAKAAAQSDYETRILSTLSKRGEAEETPAKMQSDAILELLDHPSPVQHLVGPDR